MADNDELPGLEAPQAVWVRGGTTSLAHDLNEQKIDHESEQRRRGQDRAFQTVQQSPVEARMHSMALGGRSTHASVVLGIKHPKDNTVQDWIVCELSSEPQEGGGVDLVLIVACPRCIFTKGRHPQRAQMTIRSSNRRFHLDERRKGELWVNPQDPNEVYTLAGTVTTEDWITCPNLGCGWKFKIDDSMVHTA